MDLCKADRDIRFLARKERKKRQEVAKKKETEKYNQKKLYEKGYGEKRAQQRVDRRKRQMRIRESRCTNPWLCVGTRQEVLVHRCS